MEFLVLIALAGYIYYLRNHADLRSKSEKEAASLKQGIALLKSGKTEEALQYFNQKIASKPKSPVALLYRAKCLLAKGDIPNAVADLRAGLSYDDSVADLYLETGKLHFEDNRMNEALQAFDKAVVKSGGHNGEAYHWRGMTLEKLHRHAEAKNDFDMENKILDEYLIQSGASPRPKQPMFDKRLLANSLLTIVTTAMLLWMIKNAESIHLPYLLAVIASVSLGVVEPHKGWILALLQGILLWLSYTFLTAAPENTAKQELENFSLYGSIILTFAGSFLGAFLKRALTS